MREWLKNVILFYSIILLMTFVPIIVVLAVLGIRTIIDLRYWIFATFFLLFALSVFFIYRNRKRYKENIKENTQEILKLLEQAINSGHDVDISVMGGLLKISYKSRNNTSFPQKNILLLPDNSHHLEN